MNNTRQSYDKAIAMLIMVLLCIAIQKPPMAQSTMTPSVSEGKCLRFDGIDDVVNAGDINSIDGSQQLTVEMWVRIDQFDAWRTFFGKYRNLSNRIQFQQYNEPGKIAVVVNNGADIKKEGNQAYYYTPNAEVTIGDWFHLAMVFDGTQPEEQRLTLYINGMPRPLKKEGAAKGAVPTHLPSTSAPLLLGAEKSRGDYGYKGLMDEIRIWTIARSSQQIRDNMERELKGTEEGMRLYYPVDAESETAKSLLDHASEKQGATLTNFDLYNCFVDREVALPATAASAPKAEETLPDRIRIVWVRGSGSANLVFASDRETGFPHPEPGVTYAATPEYGKGSRIGETHWYCIYNGYDAQVSLSGLTPSTEYRLAIVDYNGALGKERYIADSSSAIVVVTTAARPAPPAKNPQEISFELPGEITTDQKHIVLSASASSQLPLKYTSSNTSIAEVIDDTLQILAPGEVSITASQTGNETWAAATAVTRALNIKKTEPISPLEPAKQPTVVASKNAWPWLIAGGAAIVTGTILGVFLTGKEASPDDGKSLGANDRPPRDPVVGNLQ